ncbi:hypothetical protein R6Q59_031798 [Mikania micrantha]
MVYLQMISQRHKPILQKHDYSLFSRQTQSDTFGIDDSETLLSKSPSLICQDYYMFTNLLV